MSGTKNRIFASFAVLSHRKLLLSVFLRAKTNHFPANGSFDMTVHWGEAGLTCMRNGDYHGAIIEADLALPIACALPPPFLLWLVAYCTFSTPPSYIKDHVQPTFTNFQSAFSYHSYIETSMLTLNMPTRILRMARWGHSLIIE